MGIWLPAFHKITQGGHMPADAPGFCAAFGKGLFPAICFSCFYHLNGMSDGANAGSCPFTCRCLIKDSIQRAWFLRMAQAPL